MDKGTAKQGTYEKARVAKRIAKYGELCTIQCFAQIWPDHPLKKELFEVGRRGVITKFQLQQTMHPCKCGIPTQWTLLRKTLPYWEACNIII